MSLLDVVAAFNEGRATTNDLARALYSDLDVKKIVDGHCFRAGLSDIDDIHQLVILTVSTTAVKRGRIPEARAIYGVVKETVIHKIGDTIRKRRASPVVLALDYQPQGAAGMALDDPYLGHPDDTDLARSTISKIDHRKATDMFLERMSKPGTPSRPGMILGAGDIRVGSRTLGDILGAEPVPIRPPRTEPQRSGDSTRAHEVVSVRDALSLTNAEIAAKLNLSEQMLCFYIYGNKNGIPDRVMDEVRSLAESIPPPITELMARLSNMTMTDLVEEWMVALEIPVRQRNANSLLGARLDVDRATIWRWRNNKIRPSVADLMHLHNQVASLTEESRTTAEDKS